jgi:ribose transport system substrate-binding protein
MKKLCLVFLMLVLIGSVLFAGGEKESGSVEGEEKETFLIGYSQFWGTIPFSTTMASGAKKAVAEWEEKGYDVTLIFTDGGLTDTTKQVADLEDLAAQDVDGLILFPGDSVVLAEPVKNIYNRNDIPVVVTDIGLDSGEMVTFIITDNYDGGVSGAELMAENLPKGAKVITFDHAPASNNAQNRQAGFEDRARELGLDVQEEKFMKLSMEEGRRIMEDTLVAIPDIGGVYFFNANPAQGAYAALEAAGRTDVHLVSFDIDPVSYQMVKDGKILGLIVQDPFKMGYEGVNAMMTYLTGGTPPERIDIPTKLCTQENADEFADDPQVTGE